MSHELSSFAPLQKKRLARRAVRERLFGRLAAWLFSGLGRASPLISAYDTPRGLRVTGQPALARLHVKKRNRPLHHTGGPQGHIDHVSDGVVRGWAWNPRHPKDRLQLDVFYQGLFLGRVAAGRFRGDLADLRIGDGRHGFVFHLPGDVPKDINPGCVRVATAGPEVRVTLAPMGARADSLRADSMDDRDLLSADLREMLGPYLASLQATADAPEDRIVGTRRRIATICARDPDFGASAFVVHVARKHERAELGFADPSALWRWYVESYAVEQGPRLAPLSGADIEALQDDPGALEADISDRGTARSYALAAEAARVFLDDCLIGARDVETLRRPRLVDTFRAYPLSRFMAILRSRTVVLRAMPVASARDRLDLYVVAMVMALRNPHILRFLPGLWLRRILDDRRIFESTIRALFGPRCALDLDRWTNLVSAAGFDLGTQTFSGRFYDGNRVLGGPTIIRPTAMVDVQIVGPVRCRKGLGEACRRIVDALRETGFSVNVVDYEIGDCASDADRPAARFVSARLNILHLNVEEIPEAIAFLPDVFSNAPLVAIPYWELDRPAAVHELGLQLVDELWVSSRFLTEVFAGCGKPVQWIGMSHSDRPIPSPAERQAVRARFRLSPRTFLYLTTSDALSWTQRKNPLGVLEAFRSAFTGDEDVALLVKTRNLDAPLPPAQLAIWDEIRTICASDDRLLLVDEFLDPATQWRLLAAADCYVSLHRAEGLGLDVLDAFGLGVPVVATAYSGALEHGSNETAWMVPAFITPVGQSDYCFVEPGHVWAEPDRDAAREAIFGVYADPALRTGRVAAGKAAVLASASRGALARQLELRVRALLPNASPVADEVRID